MALMGSKDKDDVPARVANTPVGKNEGPGDVQEGFFADNADSLQRHLGNRQIQLIAIGGSIGTALFVSIGTGLYHGGPGSLFLAFTIQSIFLAMINNCLAEMTTAYPVSGGFIRLAGKWVDDALGFMVGWNFLFVFTMPQSPFLLMGDTNVRRECTISAERFYTHPQCFHADGVRV